MKQGSCVTLLMSAVFCSGLQTSRILPEDLALASASSAYQVEGAWNEDGKGESIWDRMVHTHPDKITDGSNGDIACDSYHKTVDDVALIRMAGFQQYRFSLSWPRILPQGFSNIVNQKGIKYYKELINELIENGITPIITLYHWDLPQVLQDLGGWTNPLIVDWFEDYARIVFHNFGDQVKIWLTINEPKQICRYGYGTALVAPEIESEGVGEYMCARNLLMAHARAYHLYDKSFREEQKGKVSIVIECPWKEPGSSSTIDEEAAERDRQFDYGIYTHPIFTKEGDFPIIVKDIIAKRSQAEGFFRSRLPVLSQEEISYIRGTHDFFGLNYYTAQKVRNKEFPIGSPSSEKDSGVDEFSDPNWTVGPLDRFKSVPWGFKKILNYIKHNYDNPDIYVFESGFPDFDEFNDILTTKHHNDHLNAMMDAIELDKVKVKTYTVWSLMDNFEWIHGFGVRLGLYHVDFKDPNRTRTPKLSCQYFKDLASTRRLYSELIF